MTPILCQACGRELVPDEYVGGICYPCQAKPEHSAAVARRQQQANDKRAAALADIVLTTEACPSGLIIDRRIAIIAAECAYGVNIVRDFFAGITDMTGGRSETLEAVLRDARTKALDDLRLQASNLKANGVIGVTLAYNEITGKDKSMLLVVASGTAVEIRESGGRK